MAVRHLLGYWPRALIKTSFQGKIGSLCHGLMNAASTVLVQVKISKWVPFAF